TYATERRLRRKDGSEIWCKIVVREINPADRDEGTLSIFDDITVEHEARDALERAVAEQELILANATVGIAFIRQRAFQRCTPRLGEMFGYAPGELIGSSTEPLFLSHEEFEAAGALMYPMLATGATHVGERQLRRKDGSLFWCKLVARA